MSPDLSSESLILRASDVGLVYLTFDIILFIGSKTLKCENAIDFEN